MSFLDQVYRAAILKLSFFFFLISTYLMDVTHTSVTVAHYNIDSGGWEVSLERTYQNQGRIRVWKSLLCDNHFCGRQQTIVTAISKSSPRMKSSIHHWQHRLVDISKAPIILYINFQTFLFQLHFRPIWSDNYKCVNCLIFVPSTKAWTKCHIDILVLFLAMVLYQGEPKGSLNLLKISIVIKVYFK